MTEPTSNERQRQVEETPNAIAVADIKKRVTTSCAHATDMMAEPPRLEEPLILPQEPSPNEPQAPLVLAEEPEPDQPPPLRLTRKNLARLDVFYGISKRKKHSSYFESSTMTISTTTTGFQRQAYENGILDPPDSTPPHDLGALQHHLTQRRGSIQPSAEQHQKYRSRISRCHNEAAVTKLLTLKILIDLEDDCYGNSVCQDITQIPQQGFNYNLSPPRPDRLEGLWADTLPRRLSHHALHAISSLALCHLAVEVKRTEDNFAQATYQAAYDGTILAYARNRALAQAQAQAAAASCGRKAWEQATRETVVLTCVTDGKVVEVFAHHFRDGAYHQCRVASESLLAYPNRGRELIRNAQDYARSKSYELAALLGAEL